MLECQECIYTELIQVIICTSVCVYIVDTTIMATLCTYLLLSVYTVYVQSPYTAWSNLLLYKYCNNNRFSDSGSLFEDSIRQVVYCTQMIHFEIQID